MSLSNTEKHVKDIRRKPVASSLQRRESGQFWMACAVSIQLLNYAAGKASTIISTTAGARTSWKRVRNDCLATRFAKPALMKQSISKRKTLTSSRLQLNFTCARTFIRCLQFFQVIFIICPNPYRKHQQQNWKKSFHTTTIFRWKYTGKKLTF